MKQAKIPPLIVDLLVTLEDGDHHVVRWKYGSRGIYAVPRSFVLDGVASHDSYHPDGERHGKLTTGQLTLYPGGLLLGTAQDKSHPKQEVWLWRSAGSAWHSLHGVEALHPNSANVRFDIVSLGQSYPVIQLSDPHDSEKIVIEPEKLHGRMVLIEAWLVEAGNEQALQEAVNEVRKTWARPWGRPELDSLHVFKQRNPWFAVAVLSEPPD